MRQKLTFIILTFFLCVSWTKPTFPKGCSGTYYIVGTAKTADNLNLKNEKLVVKFGEETKIIETDINGQFEISVSWISACPSGLTLEERQKANEKINPQFIYIIYANKEIKLENDWQKYGKCFPASKEAVTWKKDLSF